MAYVHCHTWTQTPTWIPTQNPMATLFCTETVPIAQTLIQIWIPSCYCTHFWGGYPYPDRDPSPCPTMYINHYCARGGNTHCPRRIPRGRLRGTHILPHHQTHPHMCYCFDIGHIDLKQYKTPLISCSRNKGEFVGANIPYWNIYSKKYRCRTALTCFTVFTCSCLGTGANIRDISRFFSNLTSSIVHTGGWIAGV